MRATIGWKLALSVAVAVAVSALVTAGVSTREQFNRYVQSRKDTSLATASAFSASIADAMVAHDRDRVFAALRGIGVVPHLTSAVARDKTGAILGELGYGAHLDQDATLAAGDETSVWQLLGSRSLTVVVPVLDGSDEVGTLQLVSDASDMVDDLIATLGANLAGAVVALAAGLLVAARMQRSITRPLTRLTAAMRHVRDAQDYSVVLPAPTADEVGLLIDGFNAMLADIRERDERLVRHRDRLEQDVEDRTHDLVLAKGAAEQANAAKSTFLATMSHEIRTPMTGLLVMAELLASGDLPPRARRYAEVISQSGSALLAIINDILDFSKIEAGKLETERVPVDVRDVVGTVVSLFYPRAREKGLDLAGIVAPDVPRSIESDPVRLQQVISNLVNNAIKFTQVGSVVVEVRLEAPGRLAIAVTDTGIGIPADKLDHVFEAFAQADDSTTRQFGGTGLGLAICTRLAEAMGGRLGVRSAPGEGTVFTFHLPVVALEAAPDLPRWPATLRKRALLAVGAPATAAALSAMLHHTGCTPVAESEAERSGHPDLRFVDAAWAKRRHPRQSEACVTIGLVEPGEADLDRLTAATDFVLRLPLIEREVREVLDSLVQGRSLGTGVALKPAGTVLGYQGSKVLVVDDTAVNREVMIEALGRFGIVPDLAANGLEALTAVSKRSYDLIFMDGSMPVLDGFEACRRLRASEAGSRHTPVFALTAHVVGTAADAWREAGMDGVLHKPFTMAELERTLAGVLHGPAPSGSFDASVPDLTSGGNNDPILDQAVLDDITSVSQGSGHNFAERVFRLFVEHAPKALDTVDEARRHKDPDGIAAAAHAIKSMSLNIGARRVGNAAASVERAAREGTIDGDLIVVLSQALGDTVDTLSRRLDLMVQSTPRDAVM